MIQQELQKKRISIRETDERVVSKAIQNSMDEKRDLEHEIGLMRWNDDGGG